MIITITGPRSVGKTTISKLLAKRLDLKYTSSDEIGEKHTKKYGGLDKAIKSGKINQMIKQKGYTLIEAEYQKDNFLFDLSGGSISSKKHPEVSERVREIARDKSTVIGLLPFKQDEKSIDFLFKREKEREHFKNLDNEELFRETSKDYKKYPPIFKYFCDFVVYVGDKSLEGVVNEIKKKIPSRECWRTKVQGKRNEKINWEELKK